MDLLLGYDYNYSVGRRNPFLVYIGSAAVVEGLGEPVVMNNLFSRLDSVIFITVANTVKGFFATPYFSDSGDLSSISTTLVLHCVVCRCSVLAASSTGYWMFGIAPGWVGLGSY